MAATAQSRSLPSRRTPSISTSPPSSSIAKGATARSAATSRVSSSANSTSRRASIKGASPSAIPNGDAHESLSASLKQETEQKEQLLVQLENKEQIINGLTAENDHLSSVVSAVESRLNEAYVDQARMEEEMSARIEVADKLRAQVRELEKEKRDLQRRYNEQASTYEAERQSFYDNEQHLKSRIQSLTQARRSVEQASNQAELESLTQARRSVEQASSQPEDFELETDEGHETQEDTQPAHYRSTQDMDDPNSEPAEMTALKLELSTLSTSYNSLQSTLVLLQTQLMDLKRVNNQLQEENESYMILLREKTLSGQYNVMKQVGVDSSVSDDADDGEGYGEHDTDSLDKDSLRSSGRSTLDKVDEEGAEDAALEQELEKRLEPQDPDSGSNRNGRHVARQGRNRGGSVSRSPDGAPRGESLADLPITGPGLDLAAELGRAENKDLLSESMYEKERSAAVGKAKRGKKSSTEDRKVSSSSAPVDDFSNVNDLDALRNEVKSLKDANKALSLYASKIIDRIIAQEGFEHVLAIDFDRQPTPKNTVAPGIPSPVTAKPRSRSTLFGGTVSNPTPALVRRSTITSPPAGSPPTDQSVASGNTSQRASRRSLSFDWKSFSVFGGTEKKAEPPNLRPLTLKPGAAALTGARKLDTEEDEEDRRERERLNATMKLMGIEPPSLPVSPALITTSPSGNTSGLNTSAVSSPSSQSSRFSLFRSRSTGENSNSSSARSTPSLQSSRVGLGLGASELTQAALEQAEAVNNLAALDHYEQTISAEMAKGAGGGFTEIAPRKASEGRRSRRSRVSGGGSGSGSTVWSAGMSEGLEE